MSLLVSTWANDRDRGECIHVDPVSQVVVIVEMRVDDETDRLVGPLADLHDIFPRRGREKAGVNHQHLSLANDHGSVAVWLVLDFVDAFGELGRRPILLTGQGNHGQECDGQIHGQHAPSFYTHSDLP